MAWYIFTPPQEGIKDPTKADQYVPCKEDSPPIPHKNKGKKYVYALNADSNCGYPEITEALILEMYCAMTLKKDSANILLRAQLG